jgi:hypothetical protein
MKKWQIFPNFYRKIAKLSRTSILNLMEFRPILLGFLKSLKEEKNIKKRSLRRTEIYKFKKKCEGFRSKTQKDTKTSA